MKVIPQCKVIGPYITINYVKIIHVMKKIMLRDKIVVTVNGKMHLV